MAVQQSRRRCTLNTSPSLVPIPWHLALGQLSPARSRVLFFNAMYRIAPGVTRDLTTDEACKAMGQCAIATNELNAIREACEQTLPPECSFDEYVQAISPYLDSPAHGVFHDASATLNAHIEKWQKRHRLTDPWLKEAARATLLTAYLLLEDGYSYDGPLIPGYQDASVVPHNGEEVAPEASGSSLPGAPEHGLFLDELKIHDIVHGHDGPFGTFNPQTETEKDALKRLIPELETRLRTLLRAAAGVDREYTDALKAMTFRKTRKFEWLVRYQVLNESKSKIARTDIVDRGHVAHEVNDTARLVGLTLRKEKGGRPRRKGRAHTIRVG